MNQGPVYKLENRKVTNIMQKMVWLYSSFGAKALGKKKHKDTKLDSWFVQLFKVKDVYSILIEYFCSLKRKFLLLCLFVFYSFLVRIISVYVFYWLITFNKALQSVIKLYRMVFSCYLVLAFFFYFFKI